MGTESNQPTPAQKSTGLQISLDWWAVLTALALVLLILTGIIASVPW
jgi:hypothetical protein